MTHQSDPSKPALITGGCGFVGANVAAHLLRSGREVVLYDDLSRAGVELNLQWLLAEFPGGIDFVRGDIRDSSLVAAQVRRAGEVYHFAAQVAVTTSLVDPVADFEINAKGTINVLEALRALSTPPPLLFTSTNKVYGGLPDIAMTLSGDHYEPENAQVRSYGISEHRPLDFHSPYGCSKGAADQYVIDYARTFGIPAVVLRMSCIYGYRQFGTEDQGWVAHFLIQALQNKGITLYGDGKQVRDILFIDDLVRGMMLAMSKIDTLTGQAFNIGGGPANVISLLELLQMIGDLSGNAPQIAFENWRPGDQRYYVSDTRSFAAATGWQPQIDVRDGVAKLHTWLNQESRHSPSAPQAVINTVRKQGAPEPVGATASA